MSREAAPMRTEPREAHATGVEDPVLLHKLIPARYPEAGQERAELNLFLAFTPFNVLMVERLLSTAEFRGRPALVINTCSHVFENESVQVLHFQASRHRLPERYARYRAIAALLKDLVHHRRIASVNCPHPHNLLSNALVFDPQGFEVNIYEDGLANYYAADNVGFLRRASRIKAFVGPLLGYRYRSYGGHLCGIEQRVMDHGYFLNPEDVYMPQRYRDLRRVDLAIENASGRGTDSGVTLVLDQGIELIFGEQTAQLLRSKLLRWLKDHPAPVLIKPHPAQSAARSRENFPGIGEIVSDRASAEVTAVALRPARVVSFFSSALKNIKALLPGADCYSVAAEEYDRLRGTAIAELFRRWRIDVV